MFEKIKDELYSIRSLPDLTDDELNRLINSMYIKYYSGKDKKERNRDVAKIFSSLRGFDILDELLQDDEISEIMINGFNDIFIEKKGHIYKSPIVFESETDYQNIIQRIVAKAGREVNAAHPIADARLPSGERVNIVLSPIAINNSVVTIRRFPQKKITLEELGNRNSITSDAAEFMKELVKCKYNIFISGGTSSGKTTFLNVLSDFIPKDERIITIEDSAELQIKGIDNLVRLEARTSNTTGSGAVTIRELIRASLRMRPDRIIVGEVRGSEVMEMLGAMNTGHDGSLSTGHANSSLDMLRRLETMVMQSENNIPLLAARQYISSSIDIIVHLSRTAYGNRRIVEITEIIGVKDGEIETNKLFALIGNKLVKTNNDLFHTEKMDLYKAGESNKKDIKNSFE